MMASTAIPKRIVGARPHGDSPRGIIPIRSYRNAERIVSYQSDRSLDRIISPYIEESVHLSLGRSPRSPSFPTGIPDRRPRHSKHPSLLAMRAAFSVFLVQTWAGSLNLLQSIAKP